MSPLFNPLSPSVFDDSPSSVTPTDKLTMFPSMDYESWGELLTRLDAGDIFEQ